MKNVLLAALAAVSMNSAAADLSFNNLSLGYTQLDTSCSSDCDGFNLRGSLAFGENFFGDVDYSNYEGEVDLTYVGLGYRHHYSTNAAFIGLLGAANVDGDFGSETKAYLGIGVRGMMTPNLEGEAILRKVGSFDASARLSGTYFFTETVGGYLSVEADSDVTGLGAGVRFNF